MKFKLLKIKKDYDLLALSLIDSFDSVGEWLQFFDIWSYNDEKYDEVCNWNEFLHNEYEQGKLDIDYSPSNGEFPVVLVHLFEKGCDRYGKTETYIWNWQSLNSIQ